MAASNPALLLKANDNRAQFLTEYPQVCKPLFAGAAKHSPVARQDNGLVAGERLKNNVPGLRFYCDDHSYEGWCYCGRSHLKFYEAA